MKRTPSFSWPSHAKAQVHCGLLPAGIGLAKEAWSRPGLLDSTPRVSSARKQHHEAPSSRVPLFDYPRVEFQPRVSPFGGNEPPLGFIKSTLG